MELGELILLLAIIFLLGEKSRYLGIIVFLGMALVCLYIAFSVPLPITIRVTIVIIVLIFLYFGYYLFIRTWPKF